MLTSFYRWGNRDKRILREWWNDGMMKLTNNFLCFQWKIYHVWHLSCLCRCPGLIIILFFVYLAVLKSAITKNIWQICPCVILHSFVHSKNTLIWHQLWPHAVASNRDTEESKISSLASSCSQMKGWDDKQIMTNKHVGQASHWGALGVVREVMSDRK